MATQVYKVDPLHPDQDIISKCAQVILEGGLVAFPTETVYGIGANGLDPSAVAKIFEAKGRPQDNPLILHVSSPESVEPLVGEIPPEAKRLMDTFWPGPLTLILPKSDAVPSIITAGLPTVAVRMPDHPVAQMLIQACGVPLAAPSANLSGKPSATSAEDVLADLNGKVDILLDAGPTEIGIESTVIDLSGDVPYVVRPGGVSLEDIQKVLEEFGKKVSYEERTQEKAEPSLSHLPSVKYKHYVPEAELYLATGDVLEQRQKIIFYSVRGVGSGRKIVILASEENAPYYQPFQQAFGPDLLEIVILGSRQNLPQVAARLYSSLRRSSEELNADIILAETFCLEGIGLAIWNRLEMASGGNFLPWFDSDSYKHGPDLSGEKGDKMSMSQPIDIDAQTLKPLTVLMVCSGNTCRSPMAEALLKKVWEDLGAPYPIEVRSAGVSAMPGFPASWEAVEVMARKGIDISAHISRPVEYEDIENADLVITMTEAHKSMLLFGYPEFATKIYTLSEMLGEFWGDVIDPFGQGLEAYERTADFLEDSLRVLAKRLAGLDV